MMSCLSLILHIIMSSECIVWQMNYMFGAMTVADSNLVQTVDVNAATHIQPELSCAQACPSL